MTSCPGGNYYCTKQNFSRPHNRRASRTRRHRRRTQPTQSAHSRNSNSDTARRPRRQWHRDEIARLMFFASTRRPSPLTGVQWKSACSDSTPPDPTGDTVPHRLEELRVHHCVTRGVWKSGGCKTGSNVNGRIAIIHWQGGCMTVSVLESTCTYMKIHGSCQRLSDTSSRMRETRTEMARCVDCRTGEN